MLQKFSKIKKINIAIFDLLQESALSRLTPSYNHPANTRGINDSPSCTAYRLSLRFILQTHKTSRSFSIFLSHFPITKLFISSSIRSKKFHFYVPLQKVLFFFYSVVMNIFFPSFILSLNLKNAEDGRRKWWNGNGIIKKEWTLRIICSHWSSHRLSVSKEDECLGV